jgi:hypothetical protein
VSNAWEVIGAILAIAIGAFLVVFVSVTAGYAKGRERGYTAALDDARLGNPPKYKLVQTAEKWVEAGK